MTSPVHLVCAACGWTPGSLEEAPYPFRCPRAGTDDGDHVLRVARDAASGGASLAGGRTSAPTPTDNPFIRYRTSLYSWYVAMGSGLGVESALAAGYDREYCRLVERVDGAIEHIAGTGFRVTPLLRHDALDTALGFHRGGGVWVKDETRNVSGSHKGRHMMGVALYLEVLRGLGIGRPDAPLAVASCGNAALAAAVVARAIDRQLLVFVPDHASAAVTAQLEHLGAIVTRCSRGNGASRTDSGHRTPDPGRSQSGDPCYLAFRRAVAKGALPFSCQGNENGLVIEGGATIAYEIVEQLQHRPAGLTPCPATVDRIFVQVGGGALGSACVQAFGESVRAGRLAAMPRVHAVQTCGGYPLERAYDLFVAHVLDRLAHGSAGAVPSFSSDGERAAYLLEAVSASLLDESFRYARAHRSEFMRAWETEPHSIASGILDDETYDWAAIVEAMVRSGGFPIVVDEDTLKDANRLARDTTGIDVDHTGSSGLAGLLALRDSPDRPRPIERILVLFTGVSR